ncbi:uncharacterized protein TNCV_2110101 [Trichonephila clavipes]|nr:uncharacterized protein TNCV_2110101 [Trichonephila clavipes]
MDEILTTARDLELEVNEDDIEELIMGHEDELTIEEHQETQRNVNPSEQEEDEKGPMPTSALSSAHRNFSRGGGSRVKSSPFLYHVPFDFVDFWEQNTAKKLLLNK